MDNKTYINILSDTLVKKISVLDELIQITKIQDEFISENPFHMDKFEDTLPRKEKLIQQLSQLDNGFERVYEHVKEELTIKNMNHKEQIIHLQELISEVMEKSTKLQTLEMKNKNRLDLYLIEKKKVIKDYKVNSKTASSYYKHMANQHSGQSYFLDKKK